MPTEASPRTLEIVAATAVGAADGAKPVEDLHAAFGRHHGSAVQAKGSYRTAPSFQQQLMARRKPCALSREFSQCEQIG